MSQEHSCSLNLSNPGHTWTTLHFFETLFDGPKHNIHAFNICYKIHSKKFSVFTLGCYFTCKYFSSDFAHFKIEFLAHFSLQSSSKWVSFSHCNWSIMLAVWFLWIPPILMVLMVWWMWKSSKLISGLMKLLYCLQRLTGELNAMKHRVQSTQTDTLTLFIAIIIVFGNIAIFSWVLVLFWC